MPPSTAPTARFLRTFFARDRFAARAGVKLDQVRAGYARARMKVRTSHLNGADVVQGGAVFTLADFAFGVACNSHGTLALAVDATISFLRPTRSGCLVAEAVEVARSRRLSRCEVRVTDADGKLVALLHGTAFVKEESPAESPQPPPAARLDPDGPAVTSPRSAPARGASRRLPPDPRR
jgi:acyl-CoA thioesterase